MAHNGKGLWKLGDLELVRPNVRRVKLLLFNYLQMFGSFRQPTTNVQKNSQSPITSVRPNCHKPMLSAGKLSSDDVSTSKKLQVKSRPKLQKKCPRATKSNFKKSSKIAKKCPWATKLNFKKSSKAAKSCPRAKNQILKSRPKLIKNVLGQRNQI